MREIAKNIYLHRDTCNVYVIETKTGLVVVHAGNASVLKKISSLFPAEKVIACLNTHHFRPVVQGLPLFEENNIDIYVPYWEQDMFAGTTGFWQERQTWINYDGRWDRYSPIKSVKPKGYLRDYEKIEIGELVFEVIPTAGPTPGAISLSFEIDGRRIVFTGDIVYAAGKVWNLASSQWNYNDAYGICSWIQSIREISARRPGILLPCHGEPMFSPEESLDKLERNLMLALNYRARPEEIDAIKTQECSGLVKVTEHLYLDGASGAQTFYLISESGKAMAIDYGYEIPSLRPDKHHFSTRRPLLHGIKPLRDMFGIEKIDVVIPSHIHDDHVCGVPLLQRLFGTELWCAERFTDLLENPYKYNVQCIWPEPMKVHRSIPFGKEFQWEEYKFILHPSGAHTFYSAMIEFKADRKTIVHTGDQQGFSDEVNRSDRFFHNYVYQNRLRREEMKDAARLLSTIRPNLIISGHWNTVRVNDKILKTLHKAGTEQIEIHELLLPINEFDWNCDHIGAEIFPYHLEFPGQDQSQSIKVKIRNPFREAKRARIQMVLPEQWKATPIIHKIRVEPLGERAVEFVITVPKELQVRRQPIAVDVTLGGHPLGQIAEALVTANWPEETRWGGGAWG
ncbi:MAG: MBL fold metallo-hydrolase [Clostridia bacterium]|nr:MBL fold metallo-hydrolase [Clostridia bacterium]